MDNESLAISVGIAVVGVLAYLHWPSQTFEVSLNQILVWISELGTGCSLPTLEHRVTPFK